MESVTEKVVDFLDANYPVKTFKINTNLRDGFTPQVLALIKHKNKFLRKAKRGRKGVLNLHLPKVKSIGSPCEEPKGRDQDKAE